jgi:hypothetical protein
MLTGQELQSLVAAGIIDAGKASEIAAFLKAGAKSAPPSETTVSAPRFDLTHVLWYAGALIIIGAMGLFTTDAFNRMGGWALATCGVVYAFALAGLGHYLWHGRNLRTPGGLLIAGAVAMVPMIIYGIQDGLDLWRFAQGDPGQYNNFFPYVHGSWLYMEVATVLASLLAIRLYPFPFILLIGGVALWFMSMDLAMWFTASESDYWDFDMRRNVSMWFGLIVILAAWAYDVLRGRNPDNMFWIHIFAGLAFWGGLTLHDGGTELQKAGYCLINVALVGFSLFIDRRVYAALGGLGIATYLGYLASSVFNDMVLFSFALSGIGLLVILAGLLLHRNRVAWTRALDTRLPAALHRLRPADITPA